MIPWKEKLVSWQWMEAARWLFDTLFLAALGVWIFGIGVVYGYYSYHFPRHYGITVYRLLLAAVILKTVFYILCCIICLVKKKKASASERVVESKSDGQTKADIRKLIVALLIAAICQLVYNETDYKFIVYIGIATVGCIDIPYKRVLRFFVFLMSSIMLIIVISSVSGATENVIRFKADHIRSSWGYFWPTDIAAQIVFLVLTIWALCDQVPEILMLPIGIFAFLFSWKICYSVSSILLSALFCMVIVYRIFADHYEERYTFFQVINKVFRILAQIAFPAGSLIILLLVIGYAKNSAFAIMCNKMMSGRLKLTLDDFQIFGISLFGPIESAFNYDTNGTPFLDISYAMLVIRYGLLFWGLIVFIWCFMTYRAIKAGRIRIMYVLALIAVACLSEHHVTELNYNIFLVMLFCNWEDENKTIKRKKIEEEKTDIILPLGRWTCSETGLHVVVMAMVYLLSAGLILLTSPYTLSNWRAIVVSEGWKSYHNQILFWTIGGIVIALQLTVYCLAKCIADLVLIFCRKPQIKDKKLGKKCIITLSSCYAIIVCLGSFYLGYHYYRVSDRVTKLAEGEYAGQLEADRKYLELIHSVSTGPVSADRLSAVYKKVYPYIQLSFYSGEDLARYQCASVLTDRYKMSMALPRIGYLYTDLTETTGIYTSDPAVIQVLQDEGCTLTNYYSGTLHLPMKDMARYNGRPLTDDNHILLDGWQNALNAGPYTEFIPWTSYQVDYILQLDREEEFHEEESKDEVVAEVKTRGYYDQEGVSVSVYLSQFDENGCADIELLYPCGDNGQQMEFLVYPKKNTRLEVKDITWKQYHE